MFALCVCVGHFDIFVKSEMAVDRIMASVSSRLERKLRLKVSATITKVARPTKSTFLGFTFLSPKVLAMPKVARTGKSKSRPDLVDPYALYQSLRTPICM